MLNSDLVREVRGVAGDDELLVSFRTTGCREALNELLRRHVGSVRAVIYPMVLDDTAADDLTQEVFLRVLRSLETFNGRARFSTWLFRVAMNTAYSFLSRQRRSPVQFRPELPEAADARNRRPEEVVQQDELHSEIETALAGLSPKLRAAIVLTSLQRLSPEEAAEIEGCSTNTLYWRIHAARQELKRCLGRYLS